MPPRICYLGFAIRPSIGGAALLFKLLARYPEDRLFFFEVEAESHSESANKNRVSVPRLFRSHSPRLVTVQDLSFVFARKIWCSWFLKALGDFKPEVILSVIHGWQCESALELATTLRIPFHAILHDHYSVSLPVPRVLTEWRARRWRRLCTNAASRMCVSPYMAEEVTSLTGRTATILYPGLLQDTEDADAGPRRGDSRQLNYVFIGVIHLGYEPVLRMISVILADFGHSLILHSPQAGEFIRKYRPNSTVDGGLLPTDAVASTVRFEADVAVLPMSFREEDEQNTRVSFPSKLVEYCAAAKPVLICAPPYASIVRWARTHRGFAEIVESLQESEIRSAVLQLCSYERRQQLGTEAAKLAGDLFSREKTYEVFLNTIRGFPSEVASR